MHSIARIRCRRITIESHGNAPVGGGEGRMGYVLCLTEGLDARRAQPLLFTRGAARLFRIGGTERDTEGCSVNR